MGNLPASSQQVRRRRRFVRFFGPIQTEVLSDSRKNRFGSGAFVTGLLRLRQREIDGRVDRGSEVGQRRRGGYRGSDRAAERAGKGRSGFDRSPQSQRP